VNVFPTQIEEQLMTVAALAPHFQVELSRVGHKDVMKVLVEATEATGKAGIAAFEAAGRELATELKRHVGVTVLVDVAEPGKVARSQGKAVRIVDNRPKDRLMSRGVGRDHEEKRAAIRKGAAGYFARHGFDRASMAGAAKACGVSKALVYHYYDSKEALLFDIVNAHLTDLVTVVEAAKDEGVRGLIGAILLADADAEHKLQLDALGVLVDEKRAPLVALQRRLVVILSTALAEVAPDLDKTRLHAITMLVFGILNWYYMWHRPNKGLSRADYTELAADFVLGGLRAL
jgi:AcrR family transcriptional regulator